MTNKFNSLTVTERPMSKKDCDVPVDKCVHAPVKKEAMVVKRDLRTKGGKLLPKHEAIV